VAGAVSGLRSLDSVDTFSYKRVGFRGSRPPSAVRIRVVYVGPLRIRKVLKVRVLSRSFLLRLMFFDLVEVLFSTLLKFNVLLMLILKVKVTPFRRS
jgi:hypothetical protein